MEPSLKLKQFKLLTFDCYGTLIDFERGLINALKETKLYGLSSDGQLLNLLSEIHSETQAAFPDMEYPKTLEHTLAQMAVRLEVNNLTAEEIRKFGSSIENWPAFSDTSEALTYLRQHYKLVILSNIDRPSFNSTEPKLGVYFDLVITSDIVGSYKPSLENFKHALKKIKEKFGIEQEEVLHVFQSLYHDAVPANILGLRTCHIKRAKLSTEGSATPIPDKPVQLDFVFSTLGELAQAHKDEDENLTTTDSAMNMITMSNEVKEGKLFDWDDFN